MILPSAPSREIIRQVADKHGVTAEQIRGPRRLKPIVKARHEAMHLLREERRLSLQQIGIAIGDRDHTTVYYGILSHKARIAGVPLRPRHPSRRGRG